MSDPTTKRAPFRCTLDDPKIQKVLERLHRSASGDVKHYPKIGLSMLADKLLGRTPTTAQIAERWKDLVIPVPPDAGVFSYLIARSIGASRIVEFGTSFGVSTIYLAAAVKDNGGGLVIGSEFLEAKVEKARENLREVGLEEYVDIRLGDAVQTLADPGGTVDMLLLDGEKSLYLPILELLIPHLRSGSIVLGDDTKQFKRMLAPYIAYMQDTKNGFQSVSLSLGEGVEFSVKL
jgi:predicted O-methyltransferase YrrM